MTLLKYKLSLCLSVVSCLTASPRRPPARQTAQLSTALTLAPDLASSSAMALPMPREAPVTSATGRSVGGGEEGGGHVHVGGGESRCAGHLRDRPVCGFGAWDCGFEQ